MLFQMLQQQQQKCRQENLFSLLPHFPQSTLDACQWPAVAASEVKLRPMCLRFVSQFLLLGQAAVAGSSGYLTTLKFQLNSFELRPESVNRNELWTATVTAAVASLASLCCCQRIPPSLSCNSIGASHDLPQNQQQQHKQQQQCPVS